jgi:hypothetical protein
VEILHIQDQGPLHLFDDRFHSPLIPVQGQDFAVFGKLPGQFPAEFPQAYYADVFFPFHPIITLASG